MQMDSPEILAFFCDHYNLDVWAIINSYKEPYDEQLAHLNDSEQIVSNVIVLLSHRGLLKIGSNILNLKYYNRLVVRSDNVYMLTTMDGDNYLVKIYRGRFTSTYLYAVIISNIVQKRIIITSNPLDSKIKELLSIIMNEHFTIRELSGLVYLAFNNLSPVCKVVSKSEINGFVSNTTISDTLIRYYNFKRGDIIQITQPNTDEVSYQAIT